MALRPLNHSCDVLVNTTIRITKRKKNNKKSDQIFPLGKPQTYEL